MADKKFVGMPCWTCKDGKQVIKILDHESKLSDGEIVITKNVPTYCCDTCDEKSFDLEACRLMEARILEVRPGYYDRNREGELRKRLNTD